MTLIPNKVIDSCSCDTCKEDCCDELTKYDVGLGNVDNTSDADKPISTATQSALNGKADVNTVNDLLNRINTLEGYDFRDIRDRVIVLEGQVTTIQSAVTTIQNDLQTVQTAIANNNTAVNNLTTLVQTYDNRITALENSISAINGNITTLQGNYTNLEARTTNLEGRVTVIEGNYVTTNTAQTITGDKYFNCQLMVNAVSNNAVFFRNGGGSSVLNFVNSNRSFTMIADNNSCLNIPTPPSNASSTSIPNIAYISDTSGTLNNLMHTVANENVNGLKKFKDTYEGVQRARIVKAYSNSDTTKYYKVFGWTILNNNECITFNIIGGTNNTSHIFAEGIISNRGTTLVMSTLVSNMSVSSKDFKVASDGTNCTLYMRNPYQYSAIKTQVLSRTSNTTWLPYDDITYGDGQTTYSEPTVSGSITSVVSGANGITDTGILTVNTGGYNGIESRNLSYDYTQPDGAEHLTYVKFTDANGLTMAIIRGGVNSSGIATVGLQLRNSNNTWKYVSLGTADN